jgi:hypothetical protein
VSWLREIYDRSLWLLLGIAGLVLPIACAKAWLWRTQKMEPRMDTDRHRQESSALPYLVCVSRLCVSKELSHGFLERRRADDAVAAIDGSFAIESEEAGAGFFGDNL